MRYIIKLIAVQLTPFSFHIAVECNMGRRKVRMIVDTGASQTVMSSHLIEKAGLETEKPEFNNVTVGIGAGELAPVATEIPSLKIGEIRIVNLPCIVLPMDHINQTYKSMGQKSIDGIIGNDLLAVMQAVIDIKKFTLTAKMDKKTFDFGKYLEGFVV